MNSAPAPRLQPRARRRAVRGVRWTLLVAAALPLALGAAPVDRVLSVRIDLEGTQHWRNALQWSEATTRQHYEFSTALRSDGRLEGANLLDPDAGRRMAIKTEYLRRQGVARLKAAGLDPAAADVQQRISDLAQQEMFACQGDAACIGKVSGKFAQLMAAAVEPDNSALFAGPPRYRFYFGYPGCANRIHASNEIHAKGETAYGRKKDKIFPYALDMSGDSRGNAQEQQALCELFTVVEDSHTHQMYVDNVYIPAAQGHSVRTEFGKTQTLDTELPIAAPLQGWVNEQLRHAAFSGRAQTVLSLNLPLDGNATVLGSFTGEGKTTLEWSFAAPAAAAGGGAQN